MTPPTDASDMPIDVTVLGSGDAFCSGGHFHAAYLFETGGATFLVDCGPTILASMKQRGLDTARLDFVVVSHMHGDHFGGLPFLVLEYMYERRRERPFVVLGPPGIESRFWELFRALYRDVAAKDLPFELAFRELHPDTTTEIGGVRVGAVRVPHQIEDTALALQLEIAGRRVLYSGDSPWFDRFIELARDVDLFLCECTAYDDPMGRHIEYRTLRPRLAELRARRVVLVHLGREMREHAGEIAVECATEGMTIRL
jgi:ribonuclease BN (tRNA processing enzyme)